MSPRPALSRLVFLPVLVLLIAAPACSCADPEVGPGTLRISVTGGKGTKAILRVEDCKRLGRPNEVFMDITVRDEDGTEVAHVPVRGRDVTVKEAEVDRRRCRIRAVKTVDVQTGASYEITTDDQSVTRSWPIRSSRCLGGGSSYYSEMAGVRLFVRVPAQGYRPIAAIARMWNIPRDRVKQIVRRDDFPAPRKVRYGGENAKRAWLLVDLEAWWFRDGHHAPR
jgi:hypothetical protein